MQFCSIFITPIQVCRVSLAASTLQLNQLCIQDYTVPHSARQIDQRMFTMETVVSQTKLFFLSYDKNIGIEHS